MVENIKETLRESYNNHARMRDRSDIAPWKQQELDKVLNVIGIKEATLLDLGAGTGLYATYFKNKGCHVTCIDLSSAMIEICKEKGLEAVEMDFSDLKFDGNSFDAVFSLNTLLHVPKKNIEKVFENINRVLKPEGIVYMGLYGGQDFEGIWEEDSYRPKRFFSFYEHEAIKKIVNQYFDIIEFNTFPIGDLEFQSIISKKRS